MKIGLIGYGKMGRAIEELAAQRGHQIVLRAGSSGFTDAELRTCDVAIEFSTPEAAPNNIRRCLESSVPVVVGTTAWYAHYDELCNLSVKTGTPLLTATNFSIGVNLFFALNSYLARLMQNHAEYDVRMEEIHHTEKKDAPSGTAITLAEGILAELERKNKWVCREADNAGNMEAFDLEIEALRVPGVPGTHRIEYQSDIDSIEIKHTAHSRKGFALGAVIAAEWLQGKRGVFKMQDVLNS